MFEFLNRGRNQAVTFAAEAPETMTITAEQLALLVESLGLDPEEIVTFDELVAAVVAAREEADDVAAAAADSTVVLDKDVYDDLLTRANRVDEVDRAEGRKRAAELVEREGIKAGRLLGWQREKWVDAATEDYDKTKRELLALSAGAVNLNEVGRIGNEDDAKENKGGNWVR
ncbi:hypothetical protein [Corynebacterium fournieri]|uniref:hypothetical protein n=1 Tax=Corynebacterium fournieri TaxID=1852390 RepID=UPI000A2F353F|nr:hypothetical protein [Corynebacterium fournieri]WJY97188.1 hypothetical protein CFOUR_03805 [Corynebacterium fournieri]